MSTKKIAIIEDDLAICDMYKLKLQTRGYEVRVAYNGEEGLALARSFFPDLILLDLMMPEMDGAEMLARLRETDWGSKIRVIVLTNISKDEAPSSLRFLHVDRYLVKAHHTPRQVADVIKEIVGE